MKSVLGLVVAMMLVAPGCGDDTTSPTSNFDLSATPDLTAPTTGKDMTVLPATTCAAALGCVSQNCLTLGSEAADEACGQTCAASLKGAQMTEFDALFECVVTNAVSPGDGGSTVFDPTKLTAVLAGTCKPEYLNCMGVGLDQ